MKTKNVKPRELKKLEKHVDTTVSDIDDVLCPFCSELLVQDLKTLENGKTSCVGVKCKCGFKRKKSESKISLALKEMNKLTNN